MNRIILGLIFVLISSVASAKCDGLLCSSIKIESMQVNAYDDTVWIKTSGLETSLNCTADSGVYLNLNTGSGGGKNVYSTLLAYKLSDKDISIRVEVNSNPCKVLYVIPH